MSPIEQGLGYFLSLILFILVVVFMMRRGWIPNPWNPPKDIDDEEDER